MRPKAFRIQGDPENGYGFVGDMPPSFRSWVIDRLGLHESIPDRVLRSSIISALGRDDISFDEIQERVKEGNRQTRSALIERAKNYRGEFEPVAEAMLVPLESELSDIEAIDAIQFDLLGKPKAKRKNRFSGADYYGGSKSAEQQIEKTLASVDRMVNDALDPDRKRESLSHVSQANGYGLTPFKLFASGDGKMGARVKSLDQLFSTTKGVGGHARSGSRVALRGAREATRASELELAQVGAFLKLAAVRSGMSCQLTDIERDLVGSLFEGKWCGDVRNVWEPEIPGAQAKAILMDDGVSGASGGIALVPAILDDLVVTYPLLYGELFPYVEVIELARGDRVTTPTIGNPAVNWTAQADGDTMPLFDATALASSLQSPIFDVRFAMLFGNNFLNDSPVNVGNVLVGQLATVAAAELDQVIATGNGTTQPQGIANAAAPIIVNSANNADGPATIGDVENLAFGVAKQYRLPGKCCFVGNDRAYRRLRAIPAGDYDQRRAFGDDYASYQVGAWPYRVAQGVPDTTLMHVALNKYRMWRRSGVNMRFTNEGQTLILNNESLLVMHARFGGRMVDSNAVAVMPDFAQTDS